MKKILSIFLAALVSVTMLFGQLSVFAEASGCIELGNFNDNAWKDTGIGSQLSVNAYNFTPSKDWMVAVGYTVAEAGTYDLSGSVLIDATTVEGVAENANVFDFMIFERKSNTMVYPAAKSEFFNIQNTALNRLAVTPFSAEYNAQAGDEFIVLVRNNLENKTPSLQVVLDVYRMEGEERKWKASNYGGFSDTQGANGWRYYKVAEKDFAMPVVSKTAVAEITDGFVECKYFKDPWWYVNAQGANNANSPFNGIAIGPYTQSSAPGYMVARGFTVQEDGPVSFSGTVMLDINAYMGVPEDADAVGFMVIEKNSNMVLYPSDKADFVVYKNTEENRTLPVSVSGSFEAKQGDEILFITRNETSAQRPSMQVMMSVYANKDGVSQLVGKTHEAFSGEQGKNNWRYYYASSSTFKTPTMPAKEIFNAAAHYDKDSKAWVASQAALTDKVISSFGASVTAESVTATAKAATAIGYKAPKSGNVDFSFSHEALSDAAVGFSVVKKATFERVYPADAPYKKLQGGKETLSGSFKVTRGDEYLFIFTVLDNSEKATVPLTLKVGGEALANKLSDNNDGEPFRYYFAPTVSVYEEIFKEKMAESPYMADDAAGIRDVTFDMSEVTYFDEENWRWTVGDPKTSFESTADPAFMAVHAGGGLFCNQNYSMIRTYTVQTDCTLNINGNLLTEVPEWLGLPSNDSRLDYMICNSKGQIVYPTDQMGFFTFRPSEASVDNPLTVNVNVKMKAGESLYFIGRNRTDKTYVILYNYYVLTENPDDTTQTPIVVDLAGSLTDKQGQDGWRYCYTTNNSFRFVTGTVLDKPAEIVGQGGNSDGTSNKDDTQANVDNSTVNPMIRVAFYAAIGVDVVAIAAIFLLVVLKVIKARKVTAEGETLAADTNNSTAGEEPAVGNEQNPNE